MRKPVAYALRGLILFLCVALINPLRATTYYFSSSTGDDNRSNQEAQNSSTPWKSLNKLNSILSSLQPGDVISFKRGEVFEGSISISASGNSGAPITFSSYGSGDKPVISGFTSPSSWSQSGNTWETTSYTGKNNPNVVLMNGIQQQIGRYPNRSATNGGYLSISSFSGNSSITDDNLTGSTNWSGGEVVIRKNHWVLDRNTITQHNGNTISYNSESGYWATVKFGYFIQNHPAALDEPGEWYYRKSDNKLGVYSVSGNPASVIKVSTVETLVDINGKSNITFSGLRFTGANGNAFELKDAQNIKISDCEIVFTGANAVNANSCPGFTIENSLIDHSNNIALYLNWCQNAVVRGNNIKYTGTFPGLGKGDSGSYEAILQSGDNSTVELNNIENTGYIPITFSGNSVLVKNNFINNFAMVKDDGGGIYTWNNGSNAPTNSNRKVISNIIINGVGAAAGTDNPNLSLVHGIYMDDNADHVEISGNTVANCGKYGLFIHNAKDMNIQGNTFFNNERQVVFEHDDIAPNAPVRNITNNNNIFFSKLPAQTVAEYKSRDNDLGNFGNFDNNYYCRPFDDQLTIGALYQNNGSYNWSVFDLEGWKKAYNKDNASKRSPVRIPLYTINNSMGTNQYSNGAFTSNIAGLYSFSSSGNCTTNWVTASKLDGGALQVSFTGASDASQKASVIVGTGSVQANKTYILKFSLIGGDEEKNMEVFLRKSQSPYNDLSDRKLCPIKSTRTENEYLFIPTGSEGDASIVFDLPVQNAPLFIDNLQLQEVNIKYVNPDDSIRFEYNNTNVAKSIALNGKYIDAKNQTYTGAVSLAPYSSLVLISQGAAPPAVVTLPSRFLSFTGNKKTASVDLQWKIETGEQIDGYEAERSQNGTSFGKIGVVKAVANVNDYKFTDDQPLSGINYYRIRLVRTDGTYLYSTTIQVDFPAPPNPPAPPTPPNPNPPTPPAPNPPAPPTISLPSRFISFTGEKKTASVDLQWKIETDEQIDGYEVQRSLNGTSFGKIGGVKAAPNVNEYRFTDDKPANGRNYYRIRLVRADGSDLYSTIIHADFVTNPAIPPNPGGSPPPVTSNPAPPPVVAGIGLGNDKIKLTPNFVTSSFYVTVSDDIFDPKAPVVIANMSGGIVRQLRLSNKTQSIDVSTLISGMYILSYRSGGKVYSQKFVKAPH